MLGQRNDPGWRGLEDTHPCKADFVAKVVEATDAVLGVFVVVVLDETKAEAALARSTRW